MKMFLKIGALRMILALVAVTAMVFSFFTGDPVKEGWAMVPTLIVPAIIPILFFVLLLDVLMSAVFMIDAVAEERSRFRFIILIDMISVILIVALWLPYFRSLGS